MKIRDNIEHVPIMMDAHNVTCYAKLLYTNMKVNVCLFGDLTHQGFNTLTVQKCGWIVVLIELLDRISNLIQTLHAKLRMVCALCMYMILCREVFKTTSRWPDLWTLFCHTRDVL